MYDFLFYLFYRVFFYLKESDRISTAIMFSFVFISIQVLAFWEILSYIKIFPPIPIFSKVYLYNKLFWFLPFGLLLVIVFAYFNAKRTKKIIKKYNNMTFWNFWSIIQVFILTILPIVLLVAFYKLKRAA